MSTEPAPIEFLTVTLYAEDIGPLKSYYHDLLGLPLNYEQPGHIAAMGPICAHDPTEGPANTVRLYFLADDPTVVAEAAAARGVAGHLRKDGYGKAAWESKDPSGNSIVVLTRGDS